MCYKSLNLRVLLHYRSYAGLIALPLLLFQNNQDSSNVSHVTAPIARCSLTDLIFFISIIPNSTSGSHPTHLAPCCTLAFGPAPTRIQRSNLGQSAVFQRPVGGRLSTLAPLEHPTPRSAKRTCLHAGGDRQLDCACSERARRAPIAPRAGLEGLPPAG